MVPTRRSYGPIRVREREADERNSGKAEVRFVLGQGHGGTEENSGEQNLKPTALIRSTLSNAAVLSSTRQKKNLDVGACQVVESCRGGDDKPWAIVGALASIVTEKLPLHFCPPGHKSEISRFQGTEA